MNYWLGLQLVLLVLVVFETELFAVELAAPLSLVVDFVVVPGWQMAAEALFWFYARLKGVNLCRFCTLARLYNLYSYACCQDI